MVVIDLFKAIKAGKELKNAATWANRQALANVCVVCLSFTVGALRLFGVDIPITDEQLIDIGGSVAGLLLVGNAVLSVATTKDAGVK